MSGVVHPSNERKFRALTEQLLGADDLEAFRIVAQEILEDFPAVSPWLSWWMREEHAAMLFQSQRRMNAPLWESLPDTTNAEEAMHWKIYSAVGRDHTLMEGIRSLQSFISHFDRMIASARGKCHNKATNFS